MAISLDRARELVARPSESLSVEIKRWIDPETADGTAKISRAVLALRNHGGGFLVIGFDNNTLEPDRENIPPDVKAKFHHDKIQGLVSRFASEPFEIALEFPERDGQLYPVIAVPPGVKTPVAARSDLIAGETKLISAGDVYVRSLRANNTPSTAKAGWQDWPALVETCFDNREADIGRFLRRHLAGLTPETLQEFGIAMAKATQPRETAEESLRRLLRESEDRYKAVIKENAVKLPDHGTWETALVINGDVPPHGANREFLNLLDSSNPDYTGWPVWLDSRGFTNQASRPYVNNGVWETLIVSLESEWGSDHIDFMRLDPKGRFYLRRALQDDVSRSNRAPKPLVALDFGLVTIRTAEAIAVGLAFGKAMGCKPESTILSFAFRWRRLKGRQLTSWANPGRYISPTRSAYQDEVLSFVDVPLETPLSALGEFVHKATQPVFEVFDGFSLSKDVTEDLTRRLVERRL
jgi:hypothetical protein